MAEKIKEEKPKKKAEKSEKPQQEKKKPHVEDQTEMLIRIYGYDIPSSKNIYTGLTRIKGISWAISNAVCYKLGYSKNKKISELSKEEIKKIEESLKNLELLPFLKNRRNDRETGENFHILGTNLDMRKEFDIKRLKEMKSYRGVRHAQKLPVRGQRTRSHFRKKSVSAGMKKKKGESK